MKRWPNPQRLWHIMTVLCKHLLAYMAGQCRSLWPWVECRLPQGAVSKPERLRMVFEDLGGTFIKLGQMLALQPDIIPLEYCNALFQLLDRIPPFAYAEVERTFHEQFGTGPAAIFDAFDPQPIATASIGQVYAAYAGRRKLAVKVQRPGVASDFSGDIRLMAFAVRVIQVCRLKPLYWLIEPLSEFVAWTREELDFRFEARHMERLRRSARENTCEYIPEVIWEYTTSCVLTIEFLPGITLLNYIRALQAGDELSVRRVQATGFDPDTFARHIVDNFLTDAFQQGMFHADLHPANLMILPNNVVGYIDFGITGVISPYLRHHLVALTLAYTRGDLEGMRTAFLSVAVLAPDADLVAFRRGLQALARGWYTHQGGTCRTLKSITLVMLDLLQLSRQTGVWPERDVIKYIRSAVTLDGLITRFAPTFDTGKYLEFVCHRYLKWHVRQQLLTFDTLVNWLSASQQLFQDGTRRATTWLDSFAAGEPGTVALARTRRHAQEAIPQRVVLLASLVFVVALLMTSTASPLQLGANLFTAELSLMGVATAQLLRNLWRII